MRFATMLARLSTIAAGAMLLGATGALAATITYTMTGTGTGTVGATPFTNAAYTITMVGDTTAITTFGPIFFNNVATTMTIAGIGTATITEPVTVFDNQGIGVIGFMRTAGLDLIDGTNVGAFSTYALATSIGPIAGLVPFALNQFTSLASTLGPITMPSSSNFTFQAVLGGVPPPPAIAVVPTLSEYALLLLVLLTGALAAMQLRRRR